MPSLFLASASPRRAELLRQIGVAFAVQTVDVDERWLPGESLAVYVARLAAEKARTAARLLPAGSVVLAADTAGICGDTPLVKPLDEDDAVRMLQLMSGRTHTVSTAISVCHNEQLATRVVETAVTFRTISPAECRRYWTSGEPQDKAGSYAIQGLGAVFVERIEGSYSGVVGLPLCETATLLAQFGINSWQSN